MYQQTQIKHQIIMTKAPSKAEIMKRTEDAIRKGFRCYKVSDEIKDRETYSKVLYHRYDLENFYIGDIIFIKDRKSET